MRIAGIAAESFIDGPGLRYVIFTQGCPHCCKGCQNPETWDYNGGEQMTVSELNRVIKRLAKNNYRGITFSGGEPFLHVEELSQIAKTAHAMNWDIVTYTGYDYEDLISDKDKSPLLYSTDILIDGKYIAELKDMSVPYIGSKNQRIIDVKKSLLANSVVLFIQNSQNTKGNQMI